MGEGIVARQNSEAEGALQRSEAQDLSGQDIVKSQKEGTA